MALVMETQDAQKARSISARVDEVARDVELLRNFKNPRRLQACLMQCAALAQQWEATAAHFDSSIEENHREFDYRNLRDVLLPAAQRTKVAYQDLAKIVAGSPFARQLTNEITTRLSEADDIISRFESWPSNDATRRNAARAAIATEKSLTDEELAAMFSP